MDHRTPVWREHVRDSLGGEGEEESPVETEDHDGQQDGHDDSVHWLNG